MTKDDQDQRDQDRKHEEEVEGMAVEVNSNQVRHEAIPTSHHDEKGQESVVRNEEHAHRSAHHEQAAGGDKGSRD